MRQPDILAAEALLRADNARVGVAEARLYPRITLSGTGAVAVLSLISGAGLPSLVRRWRNRCSAAASCRRINVRPLPPSTKRMFWQFARLAKGDVVSNKKIWFITGAGRGMGADFARAALAAGHAVVATGRNSDAVSKVLGPSNDLLTVKLDVTSRADAEAAVRAAVDRFGGIDVVINNAASFYAGYFEELTSGQFERQLSVSLIGPMNVTRAVLPVMRKQRAGHIISISSSAGLAAGFEFVSAYAASKFGLEGWMEALSAEVAPFGITTTVVNPGFFRTELLTEQSTNYAEPSIADYDERRGPLVEYWKSQNGRQSGDPAKLARALITIASQEPPPRRFIAGADAIMTTEQKIADLKMQIDANRDLSTSLAFDDDQAGHPNDSN